MPRVATSSGSWIPYCRYREAADLFGTHVRVRHAKFSVYLLAKCYGNYASTYKVLLRLTRCNHKVIFFLASRRKFFLFCCTVSGKRHTYTRCHHQLQAAQARCAKSVQPIAPRVRRRLPPKRVANYQKGVCLQNLVVPKLVARHRG